jgi:xanthine dehydrogenase accessory factor
MTQVQTERFDQEQRRLRAAGVAFAVATIVRTVNATSAKPGAKALILADGTIAEGWIGETCARGAVAKAAKAAMESGQPQYVSLRPEEILAAEGVNPGDERDGIRFARNGCPSKGSMDIFVEPVLPQPRLVIFGAGPVAQALAELAGRFDMHRTMAAPGLTQGPAELVQDGFALDTGNATRRFIVVATQGKGDEAGLRAALSSGADFISFVGSKRKFASLAEKLQADGVDLAQLAAVKAPAGLDIQAITPEEIALSILAEITMVRRATTKRDGETATLAPSETPNPTPAAPPRSSPLARALARVMSPLSPQDAAIMTTIKLPCC